ncbi:OLC1v1006980C1 [Oldenlandia corymbosa var. corymbosa]|uniref:OLC1v1006980C1 n=1 Tax=Oldenlandia corymbosa var. corymbosa TaxID=529605 RepID=A0AAV1DL04_OLDCO|nr:OLC1v1006980C1 [Oldenlandia corymbosa var. corymbosa]
MLPLLSDSVQMKEFKSPTSFQSAPLGMPGDPKENPEIKWVSEDGKSGRGKNKDQSEGAKSSRRNSSTDSSDSPKKERSRHSRKHHSKDSAEGGKSSRQIQDPGLGSDSPARNLPDIPKRSRRKKSKDSMSAGGSGSVRSRVRSGGGDGGSNTSESGSTHSGQLKPKKKDDLSQSSSLKPDIEEEEKEISGIF